MDNLMHFFMHLFRRMSVTKQLMDLIDSIVGNNKILWKSLGSINCLVTDILLNIFFCVQQKKEVHTGLKQLLNYSFNNELKHRKEQPSKHNNNRNPNWTKHRA